MLWMEAISVAVIVIVIALVLVRHGLHLDWEQLQLQGMTGSGLRLGLVLALFSFVGFESATTLGAEARNPLKTIPRAVIQAAIIGGAFFTVCAYAEVLGFRTAGQDLGTSPAPMHVIAAVGGVPLFGLLIDIGAMVSMFAGTLACITAAARVLLLMAHNGLAHGSLRTTHARNETPSYAVVVTGIAAVLPVAVLAARGASGLDVYGWLGSLATYGFIVAYALVCIALPRYLRNHGAYSPAAQIHFLAREPRHAAGARRQSLSRPRRPIRQAAVHLSGISGCRTVVVPDKQPRQKWRQRKSLALLFRIRLHHQQQDDSNHREHSYSHFLTVPRFRLPHQKPFSADRQKSHHPHQQCQRQPNDRNSFGVTKRQQRFHAALAPSAIHPTNTAPWSRIPTR